MQLFLKSLIRNHSYCPTAIVVFITLAKVSLCLGYSKILFELESEP